MASLVRSLAWPIAAVVIIVVLRAPLARALSGPVKRWKAGPSGVEIEYWEQAIDEVRAELDQSPELSTTTPAPPSLHEELARLVGVSPPASSDGGPCSCRRRVMQPASR